MARLNIVEAIDQALQQEMQAALRNGSAPTG